ncbi:UNVERIFIED_CONTAM: Polypyrimidine tract-binding protein2 [Sesamum latifolium]|uniref:Polypyrimidine tract-binding protein2 n=1 Tax=Sesamum latifolium TaxID=2727402 RepID=A0AAW2XKM4_9LAMI
MSSVSSQPQFRYTQPPSKVLHLRNLPWECTEEELIELGKPFGKVVFSAFGFVHKITTFEKTAGFQALVQFSDSDTASAAKDALDGRSIPRYLIPELGPCSLRITYSAHTDLSVKFQSHRSRDYTNPLLPVAPSAIDASGQFSLGVDGKKLEPESNVLLASIENMQYAVTLDVLHTVFSAFGPVLKIAMFDKNGGLQALIQYPDVQTAVVAKEALEGHCIYDGGYCKLHISYSRHTDLSIKEQRLYNPNTPALNSQPSLLGQQPYPVGGPGVHAYGRGGAQYAPPSDPHAPPSAGWNPAGPAAPQSMPMQMHNYPYGPPAGAPAMGPGQPPHGQNGLPHSSPMRPYHHQ